MPKTVYQMDHLGLFVGSLEARESPLEPGVYLIPAGCVEVEPPAPTEYQVAIWSDGAWKLVVDRRGETWFADYEPVTIDFIGDPAERGYRSTLPIPSQDELRAVKIAAITARADALLAIGAPAGDGLHIALDDRSLSDLSVMAGVAAAAASGAVSWSESYARGWITIENARLPLAAPTDGLVLATTVGNHYAAIVQHRRDLKDAALAAEDAAALEAIDIAAGWPA